MKKVKARYDVSKSNFKVIYVESIREIKISKTKQLEVN